MYTWVLKKILHVFLVVWPCRAPLNTITWQNREPDPGQRHWLVGWLVRIELNSRSNTDDHGDDDSAFYKMGSSEWASQTD